MNTIDDILSRMTVREKVGQCIQIELDKIDFRSPDATAEWFARYPAGSIVKGPDVAGVANGGRPVNADAVERCVAATKIPLTVAGDLGPVVAPAKLPAFGALEDPAAAREWGHLAGRLGRANGYHWCYQPCVDLAIPRRRPKRSASSSGFFTANFPSAAKARSARASTSESKNDHEHD